MTDAETLARDWFEKFWNGRAPEVAIKYADENSHFHSVDAVGGLVVGVGNFLRFYEFLLKAFPDIHFTVEQVLASGDLAAVRWTATGTHKGLWLDRAPTGAKVNFSGMGIVRVKNGRVVEAWDEWDRFGALTQIVRAAA